jgi:hypothetical protein
MALAAKRGEVPTSHLLGAAKDMHSGMSERQLRDYAKKPKRGNPHPKPRTTRQVAGKHPTAGSRASSGAKRKRTSVNDKDTAPTRGRRR